MTCLAAACDGRPSAAPPTAQPSARPEAAPPSATIALPRSSADAATPPGSTAATAATAATVKGGDLGRYYPETHMPEGPTTRRATAVLLLATANAPTPDVEGMRAIRRLAFQPVLCVVAGKLATGAACGEAMPASARVRVTRADGPTEVDVERSRAPFRAEVEDGPVQLPAPYAPACCNYKACHGKTIPYQLVEADARTVTVATRPVLAVWPKDADLDLVVREPTVDPAISVANAPWTADRGRTAPHQVFAIGARRYAVVGDALYAAGPSGWTPAAPRGVGARRYHVLATTDVDRDQRPELLVYAEWANDHGVAVFVNDAPTPAYEASCGNI